MELALNIAFGITWMAVASAVSFGLAEVVICLYEKDTDIFVIISMVLIMGVMLGLAINMGIF